MKKRKSIYDDPWDGMTANDLHIDWSDPEMAAVWRRFEKWNTTRPMVGSPDAPLPYPHYTDDYWNTARLIYGKEQRTAERNYSDRLWQWDWEAANRAGEAVKDMPDTAERAEKWLSVYHGKPVTLRYIMAGCNVATGYAYYVYGYDYA